MTVKYGKFELPKTIKIDEKKTAKNFACFIAEPFEKGFGHTIGSALRRMMLSALEAPSIVSVKIQGVPHEYTAVEGIIEDMTHIVLNLKGALLRKIPLDENNDTRATKIISHTLEVSQVMLDESGGQYTVKLQDIIGKTDFEVVNPEHVIFNVTKPISKRIDLKVAFGRGYVPAERHDLSDKVVDEILIDSAFSPVRLVNYSVEHTRIGQDTDFDKLILEVTTDGRVDPQEALAFATQIGMHHFKIFDELKFQSLSFDTEEQAYDSDRDLLLSKLALKINEIELSVRSTNCLSQANIDTLAELVIMPESDMLKFRNFGKKSLNEIKAKLEELGLHLGMDLAKYGITIDNVKEIIDEYLQEKLGQEQQ